MFFSLLLRRAASNGERRTEILVRQLPWAADEGDVRKYFSRFGEIKRTRLLYNKETGFSKGIAFVDFASTVSMRGIFERNHIMEGRKLEVSFPGEGFPHSQSNKGDRRNNGQSSASRLALERPVVQPKTIAEATAIATRIAKEKPIATQAVDQVTPAKHEDDAAFRIDDRDIDKAFDVESFLVDDDKEGGPLEKKDA